LKINSTFIKKFIKHKSGTVGVSLILLCVLAALFANLVAPLDPLAQDLSKKFIPPILSEGGSWPHILGTDVLGRDLFSRILFGARLSLFIGILAVFVGGVFGIPSGMIAGYFGGKTDTIIMRIVDVLLSFPSLLLAVCIVAMLGPSLENAVIAIGIVTIPTYARIARSSVLSEKSKEYVLADISIGKGHFSILFKSIFPNILAPLLVIGTLMFGEAVLGAAGLSFLGLGAQPPSPEWGALIDEGKKYIFQAWWLVLFPGLAILATVIGFNLMGDALQDLLDPKNTKSK
jgi:ABC-type dipeptide/oligopeptide/nickel transport system permease subunit